MKKPKIIIKRKRLLNSLRLINKNYRKKHNNYKREVK